ncbi:hypothetical protein B0H14DRAFT_3166467 [Mycena olivaceomarginata]|nr:hypothetical protein B0H14DRAFT_3166467 [Mycena olivaceomarginata]
MTPTLSRRRACVLGPALAAVGTATLVWNVARAGDTGGFPAAAGLLPGIDLAVDCAGFVGCAAILFRRRGPAVSAAARTHAQQASSRAWARLVRLLGHAAVLVLRHLLLDRQCAVYRPRAGGEIGIDLLVGDVGFFGDDVDLLLLTARLGRLRCGGLRPWGVSPIAVEPELDVALTMECAGDTNSRSRKMRTTGEFTGVCGLRTCIPAPAFLLGLVLLPVNTPRPRPHAVRLHPWARRRRPLDPEFDVESPPSGDAVASLSALFVVLPVLAVPPWPWLVEEEVDDCDESCPRGGGGESRLPAGARGDAAPGDTDTPTPLVPLGDEDRMAGEGWGTRAHLGLRIEDLGAGTRAPRRPHSSRVGPKLDAKIRAAEVVVHTVSGKVRGAVRKDLVLLPGVGILLEAVVRVESGGVRCSARRDSLRRHYAGGCTSSGSPASRVPTHSPHPIAHARGFQARGYDRRDRLARACFWRVPWRRRPRVVGEREERESRDELHREHERQTSSTSSSESLETALSPAQFPGLDSSSLSSSPAQRRPLVRPSKRRGAVWRRNPH